MATASAYTRNFFTVTLRTVVNPTTHTPYTAIDAHGSLLGLQRLTTENNPTYKHRLLQVFRRRSNSTYQGLVYHITRALGLELFDSIQINPILNDDGSFVAPDPHVEFDNMYLYLYSDYQNDEKITIDRYTQNGTREHYIRLVNYINSTSAYFTASIVDGVDEYTRTPTIMNQTNRIRIDAEDIPAGAKRFRLENKYLCPGTFFFSDRKIFRTLKSSAAAVTSAGDFHVDTSTGTVNVFSAPQTNTFIRYEYIKYPFIAMASPVIINDINSSSFKPQLFDQVLQDDGTYADGIPTSLGISIINELYSEYAQYWGL